jgi:hypothetical protein
MLPAHRRLTPRWSVGLAVLALALLLGTSPGARVTGAAAQQADPLVVTINRPSPGEVVRGRTEIRGWAADLQNPPRPGRGINARDVQLWLGAFPDGRRLDYALFGEPNPQAQERLGFPFLASGFVAEWETCSFPPGPYEVWIYVSSVSTPGELGYGTVPVEVAPCPPGAELYRANFADTREWPGLATASVESVPEGDGWLHRQKVPGASGKVAPGVFASFRVQVTARVVGAGYERYHYLQFRQEPGPDDTLSDGYYRFTVDPDFASFDLARWDGELETMLIPETRQPEVIRGPGQDNRLAVLAEGPRIRLFINEVQVGEVMDATYPWGHVSFGVGTNLQPDGAAVFRDFVITAP